MHFVKKILPFGFLVPAVCFAVDIVDVHNEIKPDAYSAGLTQELADQQLQMIQAPNPQERLGQIVAASAMMKGATLHQVPTIIPPTLPSAAPLATTADVQPRADAFPPPLTSLSNAVTFIEGQRATISGTFFMPPDGSKGLPLTFYVPPAHAGLAGPNSDSDRIVRQGAGL
jgi:hypothetical protein